MAFFLSFEAAAFDRVSLQLTEPTSPADMNSTFVDPPRPGHWQVLGRVANTRLKIPGTRHLALFDAKGNRLPLWIDRASLAYEGDQIKSLTMGFEIPDDTPLQTRFSLVGSNAEEIGPDNQETVFTPVRFGSKERRFTFIVADAPEGSAFAPATVIVDVDPRRTWYQWWYLFPLLVALLAGWLGWGGWHARK